MKWINLINESQIDEIKSGNINCIIFKHSTRCSISMMAKRQFELDWTDLPSGMHCYFLDLLKYRGLSDAVADAFNVNHESPQLLFIKNGDCILEQSHGDISVKEILDCTN